MSEYKLYQGDCLEVMDKLIEEGVKVDAIITFSWRIGFIIIFISVIVDNGFYYIVYKETNK